MALSELQRASIARQLDRCCVPDPRPEVRSKLRYGYEFGSSDVVLFEERPNFRNPEDWHRHDIAKFRWVDRRKQWELFRQFSDLKWRGYEPYPTALTFEELLAEVEADPTGIFWG